MAGLPKRPFLRPRVDAYARTDAPVAPAPPAPFAFQPSVHKCPGLAATNPGVYPAPDGWAPTCACGRHICDPAGAVAIWAQSPPTLSRPENRAVALGSRPRRIALVVDRSGDLDLWSWYEFLASRGFHNRDIHVLATPNRTRRSTTRVATTKPTHSNVAKAVKEVSKDIAPGNSFFILYCDDSSKLDAFPCDLTARSLAESLPHGVQVTACVDSGRSALEMPWVLRPNGWEPQRRPSLCDVLRMSIGAALPPTHDVGPDGRFVQRRRLSMADTAAVSARRPTSRIVVFTRRKPILSSLAGHSSIGFLADGFMRAVRETSPGGDVDYRVLLDRISSLAHMPVLMASNERIPSDVICL